MIVQMKRNQRLRSSWNPVLKTGFPLITSVIPTPVERLAKLSKPYTGLLTKSFMSMFLFAPILKVVFFSNFL